MTPEELFWSHVLKIDKYSCWIWTGEIWSSGYGFFWSEEKKKNDYVHRIAWSFAHGIPVPKGKVVMHSCDTKLCVNPAHLSAGTQKDNVADSIKKGRRAIGERNGGGGKLTVAQVRKIKRRRGDNSVVVGKKFGVHPATIRAIWCGRLWRHVQEARA